MKTRIVLLAVLTLACVSCTATLNRRGPYGEKVSIRFADRWSHVASPVELLAVNDSMVYYRNDASLNRTPSSTVSSVHVLAYNSQSRMRWLCWLPTLALGMIWFNDALDNHKSEAVAALAATAFTGFILYASGPPATYHFPSSTRSLDRLRLYARYPQGLSEEQWQELLRINGQRPAAGR